MQNFTEELHGATARSGAYPEDPNVEATLDNITAEIRHVIAQQLVYFRSGRPDMGHVFIKFPLHLQAMTQLCFQVISELEDLGWKVEGGLRDGTFLLTNDARRQKHEKETLAKDPHTHGKPELWRFL